VQVIRYCPELLIHVERFGDVEFRLEHTSEPGREAAEVDGSILGEHVPTQARHVYLPWSEWAGA
jgi:hypothetical protein